MASTGGRVCRPGNDRTAGSVVVHLVRPAALVDCDVSECALGDAQQLAVGPALHPGLHRDVDRGAADLEERGVAVDDVADADRMEKRHAVYGDGGHATAREVAGVDGGAEIHLRHEPAAEDIAAGVGVGRHRNGADDKLAIWFGGLGGVAHAPEPSPWSCGVASAAAAKRTGRRPNLALFSGWIGGVGTKASLRPLQLPAGVC